MVVSFRGGCSTAGVVSVAGSSSTTSVLISSGANGTGAMLVVLFTSTGAVLSGSLLAGLLTEDISSGCFSGSGSVSSVAFGGAGSAGAGASTFTSDDSSDDLEFIFCFLPAGTVFQLSDFRCISTDSTLSCFGSDRGLPLWRFLLMFA